MADRLAQVVEAIEERIYAALVAHQRAHGRDLGNGSHEVRCTCGQVVVLAWKLDAKAWFIGHQAQVVAGLLPETTTEWGVALGDEGFDAMAVAVDEGAARAFSRPVRREVVAWVPADEGSES